MWEESVKMILGMFLPDFQTFLGFVCLFSFLSITAILDFSSISQTALNRLLQL